MVLGQVESACKGKGLGGAGGVCEGEEESDRVRAFCGESFISLWDRVRKQRDRRRRRLEPELRTRSNAMGNDDDDWEHMSAHQVISALLL